MTHKAPIAVLFVYHPDSPQALALADSLHGAINQDPSLPGLRVPTAVLPVHASAAPPSEITFPEADQTLVVLLADDHIAAKARRLTPTGTWGDYLFRLRQACDASPGTLRLMPMQVSEDGWPIDSRLKDLSFLRLQAAESPPEMHAAASRALVDMLHRRVLRLPDGSDAPPVVVFLSHAKRDLERPPFAAKTLIAHMTAAMPAKAWVDSGEISSGSKFERTIEEGIQNSALLCILTDSYSSRSWCRREVLLAKQHERPIVVIDALHSNETRSFPYLGNVPVIRWNNDPQAAIDLVAREALRQVCAHAYLSARKHANDVVMPSCPELLTLAGREKLQPVLYPDPPLSQEELDELSVYGVAVETPLERHARRGVLKGKHHVLALSFSEPEDIAQLGLRPAHFDAIALEVSRYLLIAGLRLTYGGHLKRNGYTRAIANLVSKDPSVEQLRAVRQGGPAVQALHPELISYVPWLQPEHVNDEAGLGPLVECIHLDRPTGVDLTLNAEFSQRPTIEIPQDTAERRFAWARSYSDMRDRQTASCHGRVVIGGRTKGYRGMMPGVLEEVHLSITQGKPVYVVGGFGGWGRIVGCMLEGQDVAQFTEASRESDPSVAELKATFRTRGQIQRWISYDSISAKCRAVGVGGLNNGLSAAENSRLIKSQCIEEVIELLLAGLRNVLT